MPQPNATSHRQLLAKHPLELCRWTSTLQNHDRRHQVREAQRWASRRPQRPNYRARRSCPWCRSRREWERICQGDGRSVGEPEFVEGLTDTPAKQGRRLEFPGQPPERRSVRPWTVRPRPTCRNWAGPCLSPPARFPPVTEPGQVPAFLPPCTEIGTVPWSRRHWGGANSGIPRKDR